MMKSSMSKIETGDVMVGPVVSGGGRSPSTLSPGHGGVGQGHWRLAVDPQAWLAHVLANIAQHPASRLDELLPWNWRPHQAATRLAA